MMESGNFVESQNRPARVTIHGNNGFIGNVYDSNELNLVSNFVEAVSLDQHPEDKERRRSDTAAVELEEVQRRAEKAVVNAEKFRAAVEAPGNYNQGLQFQHGQFFQNQEDLDLQDKLVKVRVDNVEDTEMRTNPMNIPLEQSGNSDPSRKINILDIGSGISDDDFFHLTCHIEPSLIHKIEKGEFVELEKLLPKDRIGGKTDEGRLEWVHRDGGTFLVPAHKDNKISGFRRWEQAFRAYATSYCGANPHRFKEIWQYISVINTAASSFTWDNVYNYDIMFRHLMAFNPQRSWAVTYNQMWNLSMKDPLLKNSKGGYMYQHTNSSGYAAGGAGFKGFSNQSNNANPMQVRRNKSDYCWNFNKGVPCKFGSRCKFIERCKYCDSPTHGVNACHKLLKREGNKTATNGGGNNNNNNNTGGTVGVASK